jgi:predicted RNA binding protein YcfA (HicA-like mRNA interferase family)
MKIPRTISGVELSRALQKYGYIVTRQTGSHMRLTTSVMGKHHITIPHHSPLRIGTLSSILSDVAIHLKTSKKTLTEELF